MKKTKIIVLSLIILMIFSMFFKVLASELKTSMDIMKKASETKYLENDQGYISKTIVDSNAETGEVTIELSLSNKGKKTTSTTTPSKNTKTEIMLVIDESGSMNIKLENGKTRRETVYEATTKMVNEIFSNYSNVSIGIIKFAASSSSDVRMDDAEKVCSLTNDRNLVINGIEKKEKVSGGTNIEAGILVAKKEYSNTKCNKIMIILTDGVPTRAVNKEKSSTEATKETLINTENEGIKIISMLTEISSPKKAEAIFGTPTKPTVGKYYYIKDAQINSIITENIYKDVVEIISKPNSNMNEVKIQDYFPKDITDNFEFSYVGKPSKGNTTQTIDKQTNTITWDIGTLKGDEVATLKYKLKIKDMKNKELLNRAIATNEKVVLTYKDIDAKDYTVTLSSSPEIKLSEVKEDKTQQNPEQNNNNNKENNGSKDNTLAGKLPKTGVSTLITVSIFLALGCAIIIYTKCNKYKDIK